MSSLLVFVGCQMCDEFITDDLESTDEKVVVTANIQGSTNSRVVLTPGEDADGNPIVKVSWRNDSSNPETFWVFDNNFNAKKFTQTSGNQFTGSAPGQTGGSYYAVYGKFETGYGGVLKYDFSEQDGSLNDEDFLMMAEDITDLSKPIEFKHKTAILKVSFKLDGVCVDTLTNFTMSGVRNGLQGDGTITVKRKTQDKDIYIFLLITGNAYPAKTKFTFAANVEGEACVGTITIPENMTVEPGKFYTANVTLANENGECNLPTGLEFNSVAKEVIGNNQEVKNITFQTQSQLTGGVRIGDSRAYAKIENTTLMVYTTENKFVFNTNCNRMFDGLGYIKNINWGNIDTDGVGYMNYMFRDCRSLSLDGFPDSFSVFGVTSLRGMFENCSSIQALYLNNFELFNRISDMSNMFKGCSSLETIQVDPDKFKTSTVVDMSGMFEDCTSLRSVMPLQVNFVTNMSSMFKNCQALEEFNVTWKGSNNIDMSDMFNGCYFLRKVAFGSDFTPTATDMKNMFNGCYVLTSIDMRYFKVTDTTNCENMFYCLCAQSNYPAQIYVTEELEEILKNKGNTDFEATYSYAEFNNGTPPNN